MAERDLAELQRFVADVVRVRVPLAERDELATDIEAIALPGARGLSALDRLDIYREQFWWRHLASLEEDFPTLLHVVGGKDSFRTLAAAYLEESPPRTWDLQRLGVDLPAFVATHPRWSHEGLARDAARLDWAFMEAFDAPDAPPFDPRVLASAPEEAWPGAHLELHPSLRMLLLDHAAHDLRDAILRKQDAPLPSQASTHLVVHRNAACFLSAVAIEAPAFALLDALRAGAPLGEACETCARATARDPLEVGERLGGWFQEWTGRGWVSRVRFELA